MIKKIALCPPDYFEVIYAINAWMDLNAKVDQQLAKKQYEAARDLYVELGAQVEEMPAKPGLPDMVFAANHGTVQGNIFVPSHFRHDERKQEAVFAKKYFEQKGYEIKELPQELFFEGQGDLIWAYGKYFMGYGKRSSKETAKHLEDFLDYPVIPLQMHDPYLYHLDVSLGSLSDEVAVVNPKCFLPEDLERLRHHFPKLIETNAQDNSVMACNLVVVGQHVVLGEGISDQLYGALEREGFAVHELAMSEYLKAGGSVKCLTLEQW